MLLARSFFISIKDAWTTYLNRWELKAIHRELPYNFYSVTKLHIHHLFITITIAFVRSIVNLVTLLMVQRCRRVSGKSELHLSSKGQKKKNLIKDDYIQQEVSRCQIPITGESALTLTVSLSHTRLHNLHTRLLQDCINALIKPVASASSQPLTNEQRETA